MLERASPPDSSATWTKAAVGSVAFHIGLVVMAYLLPDGMGQSGASKRDQLFTPGAVIPLEALPRAAADEPSQPSTRAPATPRGEAPATAPIEQPKSSTPTPREGAEQPPDPQPTQPAESTAPGLSLHGMRDDARSATGGAVVVDPSILRGSQSVYEDSVENPGVGGGAVQGPAAPASGDHYEFRREKDKLVYRDPGGRFVATLRADGRVDFRNKGAKADWSQVAVGEPGDLINAAAGEDPYARLKAKLLKATFEMRLGMAISFQKKQIDSRLKRLGGELDKIWADERRGLSDRRELLFQRWDECDEPDEVGQAALPGFGMVEDSELDDVRQDAAGEARRMIEKFIREHAPKGSAQAFTAAELSDMNRRRASKQPFAPYD